MSKFKEGQLVVLLPRQKGWEREGCEYTDAMVKFSDRADVFEVVAEEDEDGDLKITLFDASFPAFFVRPHWIAPAINSLDNV